MKLAELELELCEFGYEYSGCGDSSYVILCGEGLMKVLRKVFKLPRKFPKQLWLTLHSRATAFRKKLQVCRLEDTEAGEIIERGSILRHENGKVFCDCDDVDDLIYPFIGRIVYLQVEYEE